MSVFVSVVYLTGVCCAASADELSTFRQAAEDELYATEECGGQGNAMSA